MHLGATIALHDDSTRFDARSHPRRRGTREGRADLDHRRRVRSAADRGASSRSPRPARAPADRDRRRDHLRRVQAGAARPAARGHDRRRLRRLGDRRHGVRRTYPDHRRSRVLARSRRDGPLGRPQPRARARGRGDRLDRAARPGAARLPRRREEDGGDVPGRRRSALRGARRSRDARARRHHPHARSRLDGGEHGRREGVRRGGREGPAPPPRRRRRARGGAAEPALRPGGGRHRAAASRRRDA